MADGETPDTDESGEGDEATDGSRLGRKTAVTMLLFGLLILATVTGNALTDNTRNYQTTDGTIESISSDGAGCNDMGRTRVSVDYTYDVDGRQYTGGTVFPGLSADCMDDSEASSFVDEHQPGTAVTVHYNPENPNEAFLQRRSLLSRYWSLIAGLVLGGLFAYFGAESLVKRFVSD